MTIILNLKNKDEDLEIELGDKPLVIGRGSDCDITVHDSSCSTRHCEITKVSKGIQIKDLDSKNGTIINGQKLQKHLMQINDVIQIGASYITVLQEALSTMESVLLGKGKRKIGSDLTLPALKPGQQYEKSRSFRDHHGIDDKTGVSIVKKVKRLSDFHKKSK